MIKKNILEYDFPMDLHHMTSNELEILAVQIREFLIDNVSKTGGHLASNLGAVELTLGLHKIFDLKDDKLIWDVGHQSYIHKILTNRAGDFNSLRQYEGLSGFPKNSESNYDSFDTGHASNSISVATGFAVAQNLQGKKNNIVAVVGDGALTGGMSYEGLNQLSSLKSKVVIVLNDNGMSIEPNIGGLSNHLLKVRISAGYINAKRNIRKTIKSVPVVGNSIYSGINSLKESVKYAIVDGVIFEQLGIKYLGPVDGHNIKEVLEALEIAKKAKDSVVVHLITKKGKGYRNAEINPSKFHGIAPFDKSTGEIIKKSNMPTYSKVFGNKLCQMAKEDPKIVAVSAAMIEGTGLKKFKEAFQDRCFDVGIAEQHGVTFAGAMAKEGLRPFVAIYSTFLQRAYDQIIMDVALQNSPVVFCIDRAGAVGADGETHHGLFDIAYLKTIPNLIFIAPRDGIELENMMDFARSKNSPIAIRYPRGNSIDLGFNRTPIGQGAEVLKTGSDIEIWALGNMVEVGLMTALELKLMGIDVGVVNPRFISPLDKKSLLESAGRTKLIVTLEDGVLEGGFGESVKAALSSVNREVLSLGFENEFLTQGSQEELFKANGLDLRGIINQILEKINGKS